MLLYVARGQCWSVFLLTVLLLLLVTRLITLCSFLARHSLNDPAARSDECLGQQTRCRSKRQWLSEGWQGAYCSCWNRTGGRNEEFMLLIRGQLIIPLLLRCCLLLLLLLATDDACSSFFFYCLRSHRVDTATSVFPSLSFSCSWWQTPTQISIATSFSAASH